MHGGDIAAAKRRARRANDWDTYLALYRHQDVLVGFLRIIDQLDSADYWRLLRDVWTRCELPSANLHTWTMLFEAKTPGRQHLMSDAERERLGKLPGHLTIYRGFSGADGHQ